MSIEASIVKGSLIPTLSTYQIVVGKDTPLRSLAEVSSQEGLIDL